MPHMTLEYSDNLSDHMDVPVVLQRLHETLSDVPTIDLHRIKSRACKLETYIVGDYDDANQMVHLTVKLMEGRDVGLRHDIAVSLQKVIRSHLLEDLKCQVTVEIQELENATYAA